MAEEVETPDVAAFDGARSGEAVERPGRDPVNVSNVKWKPYLMRSPRLGAARHVAEKGRGVNSGL